MTKRIITNDELEEMQTALGDVAVKTPFNKSLALELLAKASSLKDIRFAFSLLLLIWPIKTYSFVNKTEGNWIAIDPEVKSAALKVLSSLMTATPPEQIVNLSLAVPSQFEGYEGWFYRFKKSWVQISLPECSEIQDDEATPHLLGLLSFDRSGYIRENVLRYLATRHEVTVLPYILLRTSDWVSEVREQAVRAFEQAISRLTPQDYINLLPLIYRLSERQAFNVGNEGHLLPHKVYDIATLVSGFEFKRIAIRLSICRVIDEGEFDIPEEILDRIAADPDPRVRFWLLRWEKRLHDAAPDKALYLRQLSLKDILPKIRYTGLLASIEAEDPGIGEQLQRSLLDKSPRIRNLAQYHVKRNQGIDLAPVYRKLLAEVGVKRQIGIAGLGEIGSKADFDLIQPYLGGTKGQTLEAARALFKLDASRWSLAYLNALRDIRPSVHRLLLRYLPEKLPDEDAEILLGVWKETKSEEERVNIAGLLLRLDPWTAAIALLRAAAITPVSMVLAGAFGSWFLPDYYNKLFPLTDRQRSQLVDAFIQADENKLSKIH